MTDLYDRRCAFSFGIQGTTLTKVKELRIEFEIEKTSENTYNHANIKVFNLSSKSRSIINQSSPTKPLIVQLEVGYSQDSNLSVLFKGNCPKAFSLIKPPNTITEFDCQDGQYEIAKSVLDKSYAEGAPLEKALNDVIDATGLKKGFIASGISDKFQNGLCLSGSCKKHLDTLTQKAGLEWSIQDSEIQIKKSNVTVGGNILLLTPETGLINSPIKRENGIEFQSLIIPKYLNPGRSVKIESRDFKGTYVIRKTVFKGCNLDGEWYATCNADPIEAA